MKETARSINFATALHIDGESRKFVRIPQYSIEVDTAEGVATITRASDQAMCRASLLGCSWEPVIEAVINPPKPAISKKK